MRHETLCVPIRQHFFLIVEIAWEFEILLPCTEFLVFKRFFLKMVKMHLASKLLLKAFILGKRSCYVCTKLINWEIAILISTVHLYRVWISKLELRQINSAAQRRGRFLMFQTPKNVVAFAAHWKKKVGSKFRQMEFDVKNILDCPLKKVMVISETY